VPHQPGSSFEGFYDAAFRRLVGQLFLVTRDLHEAEDCVQEAFARASTRWSRLRDYEAPEAWVRRVAFNLAASGGRRARRRLAILARLAPEPHQPPVSDDELALLQALGRLPMSQREPVVLHYLVGLPLDHIAAQLGVTTSSVKARLFRARRALAAELGEAFEEVASDG
jgi:RNA polymerase sigma-70 factor (ECF subfamily)